MADTYRCDSPAASTVASDDSYASDADVGRAVGCERSHKDASSLSHQLLFADDESTASLFGRPAASSAAAITDAFSAPTPNASDAAWSTLTALRDSMAKADAARPARVQPNDDATERSAIAAASAVLDTDSDDDAPRTPVGQLERGYSATSTPLRTQPHRGPHGTPSLLQPATPTREAPAPQGDMTLAAVARAVDPNTAAANGAALLPHMVLVQALDSRTTSRTLQDTFFPLGGVRAFAFHSDDEVAAVMAVASAVVSDAQRRPHQACESLPPPYPPYSARRRAAGVVFFEKEDVARFAAIKMHDFVPHGQSNPLHACYTPSDEFAHHYAARRATAHNMPPPSPPAQAPSTRVAPAPMTSFSSQHHGAYHHHAHSGSSLGEVPSPSSHNSSASSIDPHGSQQQSGGALSRRTVAALHTLFGGLKGRSLSAMSPQTSLRFAAMLADLDLGGSRSSASAADRVAPVAVFCVDGARDFTDMDAADMASLLLEALSSQRRAIQRCFDAVVRIAAQRIDAGGATAEVLKARLQAPICRGVLGGLLNGADRPPHRLACAYSAASLFDVGFIAGSPFGLCVKLYKGRVEHAAPSQEREGLAECLARLAGAWRAIQSQRARGVHPVAAHGVDIAACAGTYCTDDARNTTDPAEREFATLISVYRAEQRASGQAVDSIWRSESDSGSDETPTHDTSRTSNHSAAAPMVRHSDPTTVVPFVPSTLQADILACTVYVTRIPKALSEARLRQLFSQHGDLNKVRIYDGSGAGRNERPAGRADRDDVSFGFVEFATPNAAAALIAGLDRALVQCVGPHRGMSSPTSGNWHVTPHGAVSDVPDHANVIVSSTIRCSPARSAIHDHDPRDAIYDRAEGRVRECLFGLLAKPQAPAASGPPASRRTVPAGSPAAAFGGKASFGSASLNAAASAWSPGATGGPAFAAAERPAPASQDVGANTSGASSSSGDGFIVTSA